MKFINKLRETIKKSDADEHLVDQCVKIIKRFEPDVFITIPQKLQNKLLNVAKQGKHSYLIGANESYISAETYSNIDEKTINQIEKIIQKAEYNTLFTIEKNNYKTVLSFKYLDNECKLELYDGNDLSVVIVIGDNTRDKILLRSDFTVRPYLLTGETRVLW